MTNGKIGKIASRKKGLQQHETNPFWEVTSVKVGSKVVKVSGGRHVSAEGESIDHSGIHVVKQVDEDEFLKIYTKNIRSIFELKPTTQKVLQYLMVELQKTPNADGIYLSWVGAETYFSEENINISRSSFQRALREMIEKGFIAESTKPYLFWFNPNLFFNGNRMTFVHEFRKQNATKIKNDKNKNDVISDRCPHTKDMFD